MTLKSASRLLACLALCLAVGVVGSIFTAPEIPGWYAGLTKPSWTPPPFVFPIAWTVLYVLMATALWRLWDRVAPSRARRIAIGWFFVQLVLNAAWSPVFFGWHGTRAALAVIVALLIAIIVTILASRRIDGVAAALLLPYLAWVAYATTINAGVVALN
jgi:tryptophan-rich sensory protein